MAVVHVVHFEPSNSSPMTPAHYVIVIVMQNTDNHTYVHSKRVYLHESFGHLTTSLFEMDL